MQKYRIVEQLQQVKAPSSKESIIDRIDPFMAHFITVYNFYGPIVIVIRKQIRKGLLHSQGSSKWIQCKQKPQNKPLIPIHTVRKTRSKTTPNSQ